MHTIEPGYDYHAYHAGNPIQKWWKHRIAKTVWDWLPPSWAIENKILDVGGGSSPIIAAYPRAWSVDVDPNKIMWNRENNHDGIQYFVMNATDLDFKNETFDYVLCIEVLEHIADYKTAMAEICRVLKPGGKAIIATPDYATWRWRVIEWVYGILWPDKYCSDHVSQLGRDILVDSFKPLKMDESRMIRVGGADYVGMYQKRY